MRLALTFPHSLGAPGGGTRDCIELATHLARAGTDLVVVSVRSLGPTRFPRPTVPASFGREQVAALESEGIEVIEVERHPTHYLLDGRPVRRAIDRISREGGLDAVLGWWNETLFLPALLERRGIVHGMNAAASYGPMFSGEGATRLRRLRTELFFSRPLRRADVVFARSDFTRRELVELGGVAADRIRVAHLGVDPTFGDIERAAPASESNARILFFGNLVREKGIFDALTALGALKSRDWTLRVAGWGDADGVRRAAAEAGIEARVELLGRLDRPALLDALQGARFALLPSHTESFGLANAEAQAAGLPVIAYDVAAVPEVVVSGETGWLVPLKDTDALAQAVSAALDDPALAHERGLAGRRRALERFAWDRTAELTLAGLEAARAIRG